MRRTQQVDLEPWVEVIDRLWIGTTYARPRDFNAVLTLSADASPIPPGVRTMTYELGPFEVPDVGRLIRVVDWVGRRWHAGDTVLIRCANGADRSGLVAARVVAALGSRPEEAMKLVRTARPGAISARYLQAMS